MFNSSKSKKPLVTAAEFRSYDSEGNECWEVETILDRKYSRAFKDFRYLVKWRGFSVQESTWEPLENLVGAQPMLDEFERNYQTLVLPLEPAYAITGPDSKPITINDLKKSPDAKKISPISRAKKSTCVEGDNQGDWQSLKGYNELEIASKREPAKINYTEKIEALTNDSSSHKSERCKETLESDSQDEVMIRDFGDRQSGLRLEDMESPEMGMEYFPLGCERREEENERLMKEEEKKSYMICDNRDNIEKLESRQRDYNSENQIEETDNTYTCLEIEDNSNYTKCSAGNGYQEQEVQYIGLNNTSNMNVSNPPVTQKVSRINDFPFLRNNKPIKILFGGLLSSSNQNSTMSNQMTHESKTTINNRFEIEETFFTEKTKGLGCANPKISNKNSNGEETMGFSVPSMKIQLSDLNETQDNEKQKIQPKFTVEVNRVRYKRQAFAVPATGFDWEDRAQWAVRNNMVVGTPSEVADKIRKMVEANTEKTRQKIARERSFSAHSESKERGKGQKKTKTRGGGKRKANKEKNENNKEKTREKERDQKADKKEREEQIALQRCTVRDICENDLERVGQEDKIKESLNFIIGSGTDSGVFGWNMDMTILIDNNKDNEASR